MTTQYDVAEALGRAIGTIIAAEVTGDRSQVVQAQAELGAAAALLERGDLPLGEPTPPAPPPKPPTRPRRGGKFIRGDRHDGLSTRIV